MVDDKQYRAVYYLKSGRKAPAEEYIKKLKDKRSVAQVVALIDKLLEENGQLPFPFAKRVEDKIWELRAHFGGRVFYFVNTGRKIILLEGITKKADRIPNQDLKRIRNYYIDYLATRREKRYDSKLYHKN